MTQTWSGIILAHILKKSRAVLILGGGGGNVLMFALNTPLFLKAQLNKKNYNYLAACSISLGFHRKRLIHNCVWRLTRVEVVLYCMDAAQNKRQYIAKVM